VAFIHLTKAFDLVSRSGLFAILRRFGCPDTLLNIILKLHDDMHATVQVNGSRSRRFPTKRGVKQGRVLAPGVFATFFTALLEKMMRKITLSLQTTEFLYKMVSPPVALRYPLSPAPATFLTRLFKFLQLHNSPANWARKLSKSSTDSASLAVENEKKVFRFGFGVFWGWRNNEGMFLQPLGQLYLALGPNPIRYIFG